MEENIYYYFMINLFFVLFLFVKIPHEYKILIKIEIFAELLHKIEGHIARVNDVFLLTKEDGVITISDDRSIRIWLKRDNGQFWPSVHHYMPFAPTSMCFKEDKLR